MSRTKACRAWNALAEERLEEAEQLAEALLGKAAGTSPFHGGADLHSAHLLLGHVRLRRGDVESAERHLLAAARLEGDPALRTFGPNMSLAQALVLHGRIDAVLDYLDLCSFWKGRHAPRSLVRWQDDITHGRVPDFGPNLVYGTGERGYVWIAASAYLPISRRVVLCFRLAGDMRPVRALCARAR
jgi:hypothetical protein